MDLKLINRMRKLLGEATVRPWNEAFYVKNDLVSTDEWFANRALILLLVNNAEELLNAAQFQLEHKDTKEVQNEKTS